jgi:hypothetical protein
MILMSKLKEYFSRGKTPTGDQFSQLIEFSADASELYKGTIPVERYGDVPAASITGKLLEEVIPNLDANKIAVGQFDNARLPTNISVGSYTGDGAGLTQLNADNIASGQISTARLPLATEIKPGLTQFSSLAEAQQGSSFDRAISPKHLANVLADYKVEINKTISEVKAGLKFKENVVAVATSHVDTTAALDTLVIVDEHQLQHDDRVLLTQQDDGSQNTVWVAKLNSAWEIAKDLDNDVAGEMAIGISVEVTHGEEYANSYWSVIDDQVNTVWKKRTDINDYDFGTGLIQNGVSIGFDTAWLDARIQSIVDEAVNAAVVVPQPEVAIISEPPAIMMAAPVAMMSAPPVTVLPPIAVALNFTFTNANAMGRVGPSQLQVNAAYAGTDLVSLVTVVGQGIQKWVVPQSGKYSITAQGAQGCVNEAQGGTPNDLGRGAKMSAYFMLTEGQILWILVGQQGEGTVGTYGHGGGGGGSFVGIGTDQLGSTALIVAGGGGAIGNGGKNYLAQGQITTAGASGYKQNADDESDNNGGGVSGGAGSRGGKGFQDSDDMGMDAASGWSGSGITSQSFLTGGLGALATKGGDGGFGGGGALRSNEGYATAAGGGGYSGGGASDSTNGWTFAGGGGGSINTGEDQVNEVGGADAGHGQVVIRLSA